MVFAFAGDSTITRIFLDDFFPDALVFFVVFAPFDLDVFVFDADVSVANPSVPFNAPVGVHFILCNNSLELHLEEEQRNIRRDMLRHAVHDLIHRERVLEGQYLIDASFLRYQLIACGAARRFCEVHFLKDLLR